MTSLTTTFLELWPDNTIPIWIRTLAAFVSGVISWDELEKIRSELIL